MEQHSPWPLYVRALPLALARGPGRSGSGELDSSSAATGGDRMTLEEVFQEFLAKSFPSIGPWDVRLIDEMRNVFFAGALVGSFSGDAYEHELRKFGERKLAALR